MEAAVLSVNQYPDWDAIPTLPVDQYPWGGDYRPETTAKIVLLKGRGFLVRMRAMEATPLARYTENNSPVHEDSCMEFFANFAPGRPDAGYINFETNANGALHSKYGPGRSGRTPLRDFGLAEPKVTVSRDCSSWLCEYLVPLELIEAVFGKREFAAGDIVRANFYKCGDKTEFPHFGCWSPVAHPTPDFHRPEYFGALILG